MTTELVESCLFLARGLARRFWQRQSPAWKQALGTFDDVHAEAMLALVLAARRYDPSRGTTFSTFSTLVIRQHLLGLVASMRRNCRAAALHQVPLSEAETLQGCAEDQSAKAERKEALEDLREALGRLQPRQRQVIELRYAEDMTFEEMGAAMGICKARAQQLLVKALAAIKQRCAG